MIILIKNYALTGSEIIGTTLINILLMNWFRVSKEIGGTYDYSICQVPARGEHITFKDYSQEDLCRLSADDCPLTGVCWDADLIVGLREGNPSKVLDAIHTDTEYQYSTEALIEMCEANEYEFNEDGSVF